MAAKDGLGDGLDLLPGVLLDGDELDASLLRHLATVRRPETLAGEIDVHGVDILLDGRLGDDRGAGSAGCLRGGGHLVGVEEAERGRA